ncbi:uncharacterized protein LOC134838500 [Culicoides brevitarsis]|uniref:uncharacterized protein LOC134838500 n=1 Tax=Culicoides brevitarsis TaxID=469753 RepID=UPI00307BC27B
MKFVFLLWILVPIVVGVADKKRVQFKTDIFKTQFGVTRLQHSFGKHVEGENLVGFEARTINYPQDRNVVLTVNYPQPGIEGKRVTAIIIYVNQTSTMGKAFMLDGGWDKIHAKFYVEANYTNLFDYDYKIYGVDDDAPNLIDE